MVEEKKVGTQKVHGKQVMYMRDDKTFLCLCRRAPLCRYMPVHWYVAGCNWISGLT
jgi:hypothetical protein